MYFRSKEGNKKGTALLNGVIQGFTWPGVLFTIQSCNMPLMDQVPVYEQHRDATPETKKLHPPLE